MLKKGLNRVVNGSNNKFKCEECINLIQTKNNLFECDCGHWQNAKKQDVRLYIPTLFECIDFEYIGKQYD